MRALMTLIKVGLKTNSIFAPLRTRMQLSRKQRLLIPLVTVLVLLALSPLFYFLLILFKQLFVLLATVNQQSALLTMILLAGQVMVLVTGIYYMVANFYFSRDLEWMIPLPVKPGQVILAKFMVILINQYLTFAIMAGPFLIYYGILNSGGFTFWLRLLAIFLLLPVIPLSIAALLVILLMRVVNLSKKKDMLVIAGTLLIMALALAPQIMHTRDSDSISRDQIIYMLTAPDSLVRIMAAHFPPAIWATRGLSQNTVPAPSSYMLIFSGTSLFILWILCLAGKKLFYQGLIGLGEISADKTVRNGPFRFHDGRHQLKALFLREVRLMNRTPMFLLNGIFSTMIFPFLLMMVMITRQKEGRFLIQLFKSRNSAAIVLVTAVILLLSGTLNGTAASAVSREGSRFWMSRVIPVPFRTQVAAKFLHALLVAGLGICCASLVVVFYVKLPLLKVLQAILMALPAAWAFIVTGILIDLSRPLLHWISPQRAIKQNLNVFLGLVVQAATLTGTGYVAVQLLRRGINHYLLLTLIFLFFSMFALTVTGFLLKLANRLYLKTEI